jgi:hypothetical protein
MSQTTNKEDQVLDQETPEYTQQELDAMRKSMIANYKSEITFLKVQAEYEKWAADIEEHKTRRYKAMAIAAQIFASEEQEEQAPKKKRTLKKEENV